MSRLNFLVLIVMLIFELSCALSVVNATNQRRETFINLQRAQSKEYELHLDGAQLQYQKSLLSRTVRIVRIAMADLKMRPVVLSCTQYLSIHTTGIPPYQQLEGEVGIVKHGLPIPEIRADTA
ncbi:cell division protein FtsL [Candidatus Vallotia lariciata]|uniref:cell division protein FtsL n=1 Tax=Candidatus Vallotia laricis TaxID=2018052 RepID=UPI001D00FC06|nr:cell division protein FtsL [Candidatus Vallotia lariciata]UDG82786.1 Cell division protein FtsL [Candidatus Vallotia lariciata]